MKTRFWARSATRLCVMGPMARDFRMANQRQISLCLRLASELRAALHRMTVLRAEVHARCESSKTINHAEPGLLPGAAVTPPYRAGLLPVPAVTPPYRGGYCRDRQ